MDGAAIRIASGASQLRTIGPRDTVVRQRLGFERTNDPTPGAFRVKAVVIEVGKPMGECTWNVQVTSTATKQVMKALKNVAPDAPYVEIPDDDEVAALAERADRNASRTRAAKKKAGAKKTTAKKGAAKKSAAKKSAGKKTAAKKGAAKKSAGKKTTAKKAGARTAATKKAGAKKAGARKTATKRPAAKKKSAAKKRR